MCECVCACVCLGVSIDTIPRGVSMVCQCRCWCVCVGVFSDRLTGVCVVYGYSIFKLGY